MIELAIKTTRRTQFIDVTRRVEAAVEKIGVREGVCVIYCPHTTAAVTINESADPSVQRDILNRLAEIAPSNNGYFHREGNADAHIKAALIGNSRVVFVHSGRLALGTWEGIFFCEFDGPRQRRLMVKAFE